MKSKKISIRLTAEDDEQIKKQCDTLGITVSEYVKRCLKQTSKPVDCRAIAKGLCDLNTSLNLLEMEIEDNTIIEIMRKEVQSIWQHIK